MTHIATTSELEDRLSQPSSALLERMSHLAGDFVILGAGGKMGPTLARMAQRAAEQTGTSRRIIAVSRFTNAALPATLQAHGIETLAGDLLDRKFVASLPDAANVVCMTGMKFGAADNLGLTWAMNALLPAIVCERYSNSRIMAFSTGNVYPLVPISSGGSVESDSLKPVGEYAMSTVGRERMYEYFAQEHAVPISIVRLNYACELRYGVLVDIARQVFNGSTIDLSMGYVNVIWQGDANAQALCALADASSPRFVINVAGKEILSVRDVATQFAELFGRDVSFVGNESETALLNNGSFARRRYGPQSVSAEQLIRWIAHWIQIDGESLGKPTHYSTRNGTF